MIESKEIEIVKSKYFLHPQKKYLSLQEVDLSLFNAKEIKLIDNVLLKLSGMDAVTIREYTSQDAPYSITADQEKIKYESVFYRTAAYSVKTTIIPIMMNNLENLHEIFK